MSTEDQSQSGTDHPPVDGTALRQGLATIRRRRWYLWGIILIYLPLMGTAMKTFQSFKGVSMVFCFWFVVMFSLALFAALARCPRCGNYFHLHGMTLLYLRKCLHCQLHLTADKRL